MSPPVKQPNLTRRFPLTDMTGRSCGPGRRLEPGEISDQRVGSVMVLVA
jgi:hypothetical protein